MKKLLSALLIATLLIASVACVFAVAEESNTTPVAPDELIATFDVNTGAKYASGFHTVLARIGEKKTVAELTEYLVGAAKDYNYFFVYAVEADANGNYVVIAEYEALGKTNEGGPKSDVEVPENGYLVCINASGIEEDTDKYNVGDIVVFEGFELATLATLQPEENPLEGVAKASFYTAKEVEDENTTSSGDDNTTSSEDENTTSSEDENTTSSEEENTTSSEVTTPAETTPADSSSPTTGDSGMIVFAVLAVVALAGGIVVVRARG